MADKPLGNMAELLSEIEREWKALQAVIGRLSAAQMVSPDSGGWSPKDNLAHLQAWMHILDASYLGGRPASEAMGIEPAAWSGLDEDGENALLFERDRDRSASDVLRGLQAAYTRVTQTIRSLPFEDLVKPRPAAQADQRPLIQVILGNTSEHFAEHRATIEKLL